MEQVNNLIPPAFDDFRKTADFKEFLAWLPVLAARYKYSPRMVTLFEHNPTPGVVLLAIGSLSFNLSVQYSQLGKRAEAGYFTDRFRLVFEANEGTVRNALYQALVQRILLDLPAFLRQSRIAVKSLRILVPVLGRIGSRIPAISDLGFRYAFASAE